MFLRGLRNTSVLDVLHFPTLDDFRTFERLGDARSTPLSGHCDSARAHLALPSVDLAVQRTFPRILEANYRTRGLVFFVPLMPTVNATVNGVSATNNCVMAVHGEAVCQAVESQANLYALVNLHPSISDRGWPEAVDRVSLFQIENADALRSFRLVVQELLAFASSDPGPARNMATLRHMEESLLASLDEAVTSAPAIPSSTQYERCLRTVRRMEDYLSLYPAADVSAAGLAHVCAVSQGRCIQRSRRCAA